MIDSHYLLLYKPRAAKANSVSEPRILPGTPLALTQSLAAD